MSDKGELYGRHIVCVEVGRSEVLEALHQMTGAGLLLQLTEYSEDQ